MFGGGEIVAMDIKFSIGKVALDYFDNPDRYSHLIKSAHEVALIYGSNAFSRSNAIIAIILLVLKLLVTTSVILPHTTVKWLKGPYGIRIGHY